MNLYQTLSMALKSILNNKVRSILTMLGIIIGVGAVITLVAVIQSYNDQIMRQFDAMGTNKINLDYYFRSESRVNEMVDYIEKDLKDYIIGISPNAQINDAIRYKAKSTDDTPIYFGNATYDAVNENKLASGRSINQTDIKNRTRVCVIGETVRKTFFGAMSPIGQKIKIKGLDFQIIGVYEANYEGQRWTPDDKVVLPVSVMRTLVGRTRIDGYVVKAKDRESVQPFVDKVTEHMQSIINQDREYFQAYSSEQWRGQTEGMTTTMSLVAGGVAGISLLVGGIGIMNIMLVSVTERTREIGIRMAIGARRRDIISQFLIEAAAVSASGGLLGIALGFFGAALLGAFMLKELCLPQAPLVLGSFLFSALLGIVFGIYPANKASKLQPVDALRTQ